MLLKSIFWYLELLFEKLGFLRSSYVDIEILYESSDYLIVNKPEDVYVNNHFKEVSQHFNSLIVKCCITIVNFILFVTETIFRFITKCQISTFG